MSISGMSVVGGQVSYKKMTNKLSDEEYAVAKAHIWMDMLKKRQRPSKWLKPNKNGTKINFDFIATQAEMDTALDEIEVYIKGINREYGTDFELTRG